MFTIKHVYLNEDGVSETEVFEAKGYKHCVQDETVHVFVEGFGWYHIPPQVYDEQGEERLTGSSLIIENSNGKTTDIFRQRRVHRKEYESILKK